MTLRSDVAVDSIHKIEILTTTRELLLGEPPEVCHIQAFDEEGIKGKVRNSGLEITTKCNIFLLYLGHNEIHVEITSTSCNVV